MVDSGHPTSDALMPQGHQKNILVLHVDDDVASLMMAEGALENAGFDVVQAENGEEALKSFQQHSPDLIIMDAVMPVMDGFDAIAAIREMPAGEHVPILMITGLDDLDSITRAYDEGATDFLTKPINFFTLPYRMQYMLRAKLTADALRLSQSKLDSAQRIARLGHWECSIGIDNFSWSREFSRVMSLSETLHGGQIHEFLSNVIESDRTSVESHLEQGFEEQRSFAIEFSLDDKSSNAIRTIRMEAEPHHDEGGVFTHLLGTVQDITERTDAQKQIHNLAYYDLVTGLPNRAQLYERLENVLKLAVRRSHEFALLFLDLDHFKQVNDTLGHDAGDELLQQVSDRLTRVVRETDSVSRNTDDELETVSDPHTVARLGGDEFVVLLGSINRADDAARVAERIAQVISQPYTINDTVVSVTTTIGISVFPMDGDDSETLMKHADVAMYHAKEQGRNGYQFYSRQIHEAALARFSMEADLKKAIENNELKLVFQPKVDLIDHRIAGVEALVRWTHESDGPINPSEFIPVAEETGLILPLGRWVLEAACVQMQTWINQGREPFSVAVNCSPVQFERGTIIDDIDNAISVSGLDPRLLEVELTERLFLEDIDAGIAILRQMKELGIQVSVDDFGTGFSSLSYLKRLPVDKLKIDQSFVRDLEVDPGDAAIVSAIITLAHNLGLSVIAEGVETAGQMEILERYRCNEAQGYFFSYPLSSYEATDWLINRELNTITKKVSGL